MPIELRINGTTHAVEVTGTATLLSVLRDDLGLTGTRYGCGIGRCGACFVLAEAGAGAPGSGATAVASCLLTAAQAARMEITTVEGLASPNALHPVQDAFIAEDAMQCGYCTSGMLISAAALLAREPHPAEPEIRDALAANLCRCGVYRRAIEAVKKASA